MTGAGCSPLMARKAATTSRRNRRRPPAVRSHAMRPSSVERFSAWCRRPRGRGRLRRGGSSRRLRRCSWPEHSRFGWLTGGIRQKSTTSAESWNTRSIRPKLSDSVGFWGRQSSHQRALRTPRSGSLLSRRAPVGSLSSPVPRAPGGRHAARRHRASRQLSLHVLRRRVPGVVLLGDHLAEEHTARRSTPRRASTARRACRRARST